MSSAEKLCLQWNDFQENILSSFKDLRLEKEFTDVTLACEDGQQIEAHRIVLTSSSPLFKNLLKANKHQHPLVYMRGVKSDDLHAILDFLYCGEANVYQENLDSFLAIAEELRLKGLMGQAENVEKKTNNTYTDSTLGQISSQPIYKSDKSNTERRLLNLEPNLKDQSAKIQTHFESANILQELDAQVKSMMEKGQNISSDGRNRTKICKMCGKEGQGINIRDHIEANHLEGISLPCNLCEKTFRSRHSLRQHKCTR